MGDRAIADSTLRGHFMNFIQLRSDLLVLWLAATVAVCAGFFVNQFRDAPLPLVYKNKAERLEEAVQRIAAPQPAPVSKPEVQLSETLSLAEFSSYVDSRQGLVLDARPEIFHRLGHVPGALSLPRDEFESGYARLKDKLEANRSQALVIYCSSASCEDAALVKKSLASLGFTNLAIFEGGWSEWSGSGKPEEVSP